MSQKKKKRLDIYSSEIKNLLSRNEAYICLLSYGCDKQHDQMQPVFLSFFCFFKTRSHYVSLAVLLSWNLLYVDHQTSLKLTETYLMVLLPKLEIMHDPQHLA